MVRGLIYIIVGLSLVFNIFLGIEYYQRMTQFRTKEESKGADLKQQEAGIQQTPLGIGDDVIARNGLVHKYEGSIISGALLIPGFGGARLVGVDGRLIQVWRLKDNYWISGVKLLQDGSLAYINKRDSVVRIVDRESKVLWELSGDPQTNHFSPYLWAFDKNNEMYFVKKSKDNNCPYVVRVNRDKKVTWSMAIPQKFCNLDLKAVRERDALGIYSLDFIQKFTLTGRQAIAVTTGAFAFVTDIESKKVVWQYKREDDGYLITSLKFQKNGKMGKLMSDSGFFMRLKSVDFSEKQGGVKGNWAITTITDPKADFFDLGSEHVLVTDGGARFYELYIPHNGRISREVPALWSFFVTTQGPRDHTSGFDYIEKL